MRRPFSVAVAAEEVVAEARAAMAAVAVTAATAVMAADGDIIAAAAAAATATRTVDATRAIVAIRAAIIIRVAAIWRQATMATVMIAIAVNVMKPATMASRRTIQINRWPRRSTASAVAIGTHEIVEVDRATLAKVPSALQSKKAPIAIQVIAVATTKIAIRLSNRATARKAMQTNRKVRAIITLVKRKSEQLPELAR